MRPYEVMIIFASDLEDSVIDTFIDRSLDVLRTNGATPGTVDRWGRRNFAYEVKHRRDGYYVLVDFSGEPKAVSELDRFLILLDEVVRHKIVRLPERVAARATTGPRGRAKSAAAG